VTHGEAEREGRRKSTKKLGENGYGEEGRPTKRGMFMERRFPRPGGAVKKTRRGAQGRPLLFYASHHKENGWGGGGMHLPKARPLGGKRLGLGGRNGGGPGAEAPPPSRKTVSPQAVTKVRIRATERKGPVP